MPRLQKKNYKPCQRQKVQFEKKEQAIRTKYSREIKNIRKLSGMKGTFACVLNSFKCVQFFATLWIVACQSPLSMRFSRQEYWSVFPCPSPEDLPNPVLNPSLLYWQVDSLPMSHLGCPTSSLSLHEIHTAIPSIS